MAVISAKPQIDAKIYFVIDESEARALEALAGYGDDAFIEAFYEKLGQAYMRKHEPGLRSFLQSVRGCVGPGLRRLDNARKAFDGPEFGG